MESSASPLRIFYLEDNPLIVFHIEAMIEDLGYVFAGSASSFAALVGRIETMGSTGCWWISIWPTGAPARLRKVASPAWHSKHLRHRTGSDRR